MVTRKVGKYEVGRTIGEGTFAKVKFARNTETGEAIAMKVLAKSTILKHRMVNQIRREISIMKIVRHPNIVRLHEVLASRTKIYIILEFVTGGELFDKIVHQGKLPEDETRQYFQQLIDAVDYCHSRGVFHRDLKPENLLLDSQGNLKISDFGLSALPQQGVGLLHTTCGTPNYVAPEVLSHQGYVGSAADVWSCGVILYVLMAGYLPFEEADLSTLYKKINAAEFSCPSWFSSGAKSLICRILDPNPKTRVHIEGIRNDVWFTRNYVPVRYSEAQEVNLDDIHAVFNDIEDQFVTEQVENNESGPLIMNAFEMFTLSQGLNLSALFDRQQDYVKRQTRFVSRYPAKAIIANIEAVAESYKLKVHSQNYKINAAEFSCPSWFSSGAKSLICRILDPNPKTRVHIEGIRNDVWFTRNYVPVRYSEAQEVNLDDIHAVFNDIEDQFVTEQVENNESGPLIMNAFEMFTLSQGLNLSALFDRQQDYVKRQTRFVSRYPAKAIIANIEAVAESYKLKVHSQNYKMRLEGVSPNKMNQFAVVVEVFEVAPSLFMVDVRKAAGETLQYHRFYKNLCSKLEHIIWKPADGTGKSDILKTAM